MAEKINLKAVAAEAEAEADSDDEKVNPTSPFCYYVHFVKALSNGYPCSPQSIYQKAFFEPL
jgi:hypothetical protein